MFGSAEIEAYAATHSFPESELLARLREETLAVTDSPQMLVGSLMGSLLRLLVKLVQANRVLELGCFTGYSALVMAEGMGEAGRLITCDIDPGTSAIARRYWAQSPHGNKIELRIGPAIETLERVGGPFDLVFIDADKKSYCQYWRACVPLVRKGGVLVADNVLWRGGVLAPSSEHERALAAFNEEVSGDPRVESVMIPLRDGVSVSLKCV